MFIQLTRTDGIPVWLNACFVVTVEPSRGGGSIVVPIGDGLDYEVKESPETVLSMLDGAPPATVVPVPPPKALTPRPDDVSPDANPEECDRLDEAKDAPARGANVGKTKTPARKKAAAEKVGTDGTGAEKADGAPKKKRAATKKKSAVDVPEKPLLQGDVQKIVDDLKSRKCRTVKRMRNAIKSFYGKTDSGEIDGIIETMIGSNYILVEADGHVKWIA